MDKPLPLVFIFPIKYNNFQLQPHFRDVFGCILNVNQAEQKMSWEREGVPACQLLGEGTYKIGKQLSFFSSTCSPPPV